MPSSRPVRLLAALVVVSGAGALSACGKDDAASSGSTYDVKASDDGCDVEETTIPAGSVTFAVENTGNEVTEVYVYGKDGEDFTKIMSEVENIGPGTGRDLDVTLAAGDYQVACKPGMVGDGIRTDITVTGESDDEASSDEVAYDRELELGIDSGGEVTAPAELTADVGEKIEFKLENDSSEEYYLELLDPDGEELGETEAAAGGDGEFIAELETEGDYSLKTFADGAEDDATTQTLTVADAG